VKTGTEVEVRYVAHRGLAAAINEMLKRRSVAEWLRRGPVGTASWTPAL